LLDENGTEVILSSKHRRWNPAVLEQTFDGTVDGRRSVLIRERKSILPSDVAVSVVKIRNVSRKSRTLKFAVWTVQEHMPSQSTTWVAEPALQDDVFTFKKFVRPSVSPHIEIACALGMRCRKSSHSALLSERTSTLPRWKFTPWSENHAGLEASGKASPPDLTSDGLLYLALQTSLRLKPAEEVEIPVAFGAGPVLDETVRGVRSALRQENPTEISELNWKDYFGSVPQFTSSDEHFNKYYWYRWYGLRLNTQYGGEGHYKRPFVSEGVGYFRAPISYSAQCHMLENRWMHDPDLARGSLLTFLDNQRDDGGFRGYIDVNYYRQEMFYHANWGNALRQLGHLHPSVEFLQEVYEGLKKYASYFDRERDEEVSGLYDIDNHYETGQEYMHRYTAVHPKADEEHWGEVFRLKGVDVTVYLYELKKALSLAAETLGKTDESELWRLESDRIKTAVLEKMWDPDEEMFFDVDPASGERTMVKAATCFYPYFTDIVDARHLPGLKRHLLNKREFWSRYPVASTSMDDETFSATPSWKGKRMNCPWNGRVWPMTNSHIAEALAHSAIMASDSGLRKKTASFITSFVRMMFFDGDVNRPNCFEHYNPETGHPSEYRGIDDYQHSWVNDLIIKYVCGIRPDDLTVVVDPFPFGLDEVEAKGVLIRGRRLGVSIRKRKFTVSLDDQQHAESEIGRPIEIQI
ncbi:MAG TPA: trehalase family glycosidase, partial [Bacteroidota bacterium]|nr:trehalase family glycosidase [Bacteroidota bacterium]